MWLWIGFYYYVWILNQLILYWVLIYDRRDWIIWKMGKVCSDCVYDYVLRYTLSMNVLEISFLNMIGTLFEQVHHGVLNFWRYHSCLAFFFLWFWCSCLLCLFILELEGTFGSFWLMRTRYVLDNDVSLLFLFINNLFSVVEKRKNGWWKP